MWLLVQTSRCQVPVKFDLCHAVSYVPRSKHGICGMVIPSLGGNQCTCIYIYIPSGNLT